MPEKYYQDKELSSWKRTVLKQAWKQAEERDIIGETRRMHRANNDNLNLISNVVSVFHLSLFSGVQAKEMIISLGRGKEIQLWYGFLVPVYIVTCTQSFPCLGQCQQLPVNPVDRIKSQVKEPESVQNIHCSGTILINTSSTGAIPGGFQ